MSLKRLPQFLYSQTSRRVLDLSYDNLTGMFPSWLLTNNSRMNKLSFRSNSFIGPLRLPSLHNPKLFLLDTTGNHLGGKIPQSFGLVFPNLQFLIMDENSFEGEIPPSFGKMRSLKYLSLSNNALVGNIPSEFGELTSLLLLDLSNNKLSGEVTKELVFGCSQLQILKLSNNNLEGEIFPLLSGLTNFEFFYVLYLDGNKFKGEILDFAPTSPFSMLNRLDLSNNNISGQLPRWIGNFWSLELLVMSNNYFDGPIPVEFCGLINLVYFDLSLNNLSGSIPSCFNLSSIKHVILSQNKLVGNITYAFQGSSSLVMLDLSNNHLSGTIPTQISSFSALSVVSLKGNHFEGEIPLQLCQLNKLSMVDLSHNNLSGTIPHCLGNFTLETLEEKSIVGKGTLDYSDWFNTRLDTRKTSPSLDDGMMDIYNFQFGMEGQVNFSTKGNSYMYRGYILENMAGFDFSSNNLYGKIPSEIGNLCHIRTLNLSHNSFTGFIPPSFSNLSQIESLDLSHNHLTGPIPPQLAQLNALEVFMVAFNNLSGPIPDQKGQFGTFDEVSYQGNPRLCGHAIHINCMKIEPISTTPTNEDEDVEDDDGFFGMSFYVSFLISYGMTVLVGVVVLIINPYWRQAWFRFIQVFITSCQDLVLDGLLWLQTRSLIN